MSEEKANEKTEKWVVKEEVAGTSYVMMGGKLVEVAQGEENGKSGGKIRKKWKNLLDKTIDFFVRIWDTQFSSLVFSNFFVLCVTLVITAIYAYICWMLEEDESKRVLIIIDTMVPGALTYFISVIMQDITEIARFKEGKLCWSCTAFPIMFTAICAVAGVGFKFIQSGTLAVVVTVFICLCYVFSIISLMQIQVSKNDVRKSLECEKREK